MNYFVPSLLFVFGAVAGFLTSEFTRSADNLEISRVTPASTVAASRDSVPQEVAFQGIDVPSLTAIDQAYASIPHRRTRFDPTNASLLPSHREYLHEVVSLMDQAVLWRVSGMQAVARHDAEVMKWERAGQRLLSGLGRLQPPPKLADYHSMIEATVESIRAFIHCHANDTRQWTPKRFSQDAYLANACRASRAAYQHFIVIYPRLDAHGKAAFYDVHHALDPL